MINFLEKHKTLAFILTLLIAIEVFYISSLSVVPSPENIPAIPIIYHFTVFFLFSFFLLATIKGDKKLKTSNISVSFIISSLYAISDEIHQSFVPLRTSSVGDVIVDVFGILTSITTYIYLDIKTKKIKRYSINST